MANPVDLETFLADPRHYMEQARTGVGFTVTKNGKAIAGVKPAVTAPNPFRRNQRRDWKAVWLSLWCQQYRKRWKNCVVNASSITDISAFATTVCIVWWALVERKNVGPKGNPLNFPALVALIGCIAFWTLGPPIWFWFEFVFLWRPNPRDRRRFDLSEYKQTFDASRNIWVALVGLLTAVFVWASKGL